jgi:hypothetical protein
MEFERIAVFQDNDFVDGRDEKICKICGFLVCVCDSSPFS